MNKVQVEFDRNELEKFLDVLDNAWLQLWVSKYNDADLVFLSKMMVKLRVKLKLG